MGEVLIGRERPFAAVLSEDEGAYKTYCHNCMQSLATRRTKEKCHLCQAHYCAKPMCGLHCEQHTRECEFIDSWKQSDLNIYTASERPTDKMLFLLHAVFSGGLVFEHALPLVPAKSAPLQLHVSELFDNAGNVDKTVAELNLEYATYMSSFLEETGTTDLNWDHGTRVRELVKLLRFYDTNALCIRDDLRGRTIAKGLYLSLSLFNHSCAPNCVVSFEGDSATVRTTRLVVEGEELCISYVDEALPRQARRAQLHRQWRFHCECGKCSSAQALEREVLLHGTYCPIQGCRSRLATAAAMEEALALTQEEEEEEEENKKQGEEEKEDRGGVAGSAAKTGGGAVALDLRPNALAVTSVPYVDQSFLPSMAGYLGDRAGYTFREGRHGPGYYQEEDAYGYAIAQRGDDVGLHCCTGCSRAGADVYLQKALVLTAERHKFFYTHKQPAIDPRIAAFETVAQLRQVANLELACLHPFHPSVAETLRACHRMHVVLEQHGKAVQVLRVLAARDELTYGLVAPQTAHTSWLLADALLTRSHATQATASPVATTAVTATNAAVTAAASVAAVAPPRSSPQAPLLPSPLTRSTNTEKEEEEEGISSPTNDANTKEKEDQKEKVEVDASYRDACGAADWAQKALQIMAVLYGRNHELTYACHVTLDMAHFRMEHCEKRDEAEKAKETARCEAVATALTTTTTTTTTTEEEEEEEKRQCEDTTTTLNNSVLVDTNAAVAAVNTDSDLGVEENAVMPGKENKKKNKKNKKKSRDKDKAARDMEMRKLYEGASERSAAAVTGDANDSSVSVLALEAAAAKPMANGAHKGAAASGGPGCQKDGTKNTAPAAPSANPGGLGGSSFSPKPAECVDVQCPACATVTSLPAGKRLVPCPNCGQFCTALHKFVEGVDDGGDDYDDEGNRYNANNAVVDDFGVVLSGILKDCHNAFPQLHQPGDMLPTNPQPFSLAGLSPTRANTCGVNFFDANLRGAIGQISQDHREEWHPCDVCSAPRAVKRCAGCKVNRYCSMACAAEDYTSGGHKQICKVLAKRRSKTQAKWAK